MAVHDGGRPRQVLLYVCNYLNFALHACKFMLCMDYESEIKIYYYYWEKDAEDGVVRKEESGWPNGRLMDVVKENMAEVEVTEENTEDRNNGDPSLFVDRQMALVCNSDIHSTGSSIVYMLMLECLGR